MLKTKEISPEASKVFLAAVEPEYYSIPLPMSAIKCLRRYPTTAEKIACNATLIPNSDEWEIKLEKKYGFINTETIFEEEKQRTNIEVQQLFSIFVLDLKKNSGLTEEQAREIIMNQDKDNLLSPYQKELMKKLIEKATLTQNNALEDITFFLSKRLHPLWNAEDTAVLPKSLLEQFKYFIEQEKNGWVEEEVAVDGEGLGESSVKELPPTSTGTKEK